MKKIIFILLFVNCMTFGKLFANNLVDTCKIWYIDLPENTGLKRIYNEEVLEQSMSAIRKMFISQYQKRSNDVVVLATDEEMQHLNYVFRKEGHSISLSNTYLKLQLLYNEMNTMVKMTCDKINKKGEIINSNYIDFKRDDLFGNEMEKHIDSLIKKIFPTNNISDTKSNFNNEEEKHIDSSALLPSPITTTTKFNLKSLVPGWAQFEKGEKGKAHLFLWSEVVLIPSAIVSWCHYDKYKELSHTPSRNQSAYKTNRDLCLGVGIATTALAVGFYAWNIIEANTNKNKAFAFYAAPNEYGVALSLKF
ncbi:MAG: hypothetical protein NC250_03235 [Alistipes senegalensis]|nr:hypothetical protein [Bacteroides cellulosilyticus]MCM1351730.1 hypothetical protein [Alistipes senegalensis]